MSESENTRRNPWIDISTPLHNGVVHWPGDRPFELRRDLGFEGGAGMNLSSFAMSAHIGTHMDAPLHFLENGAGMDQLAFETVIGRARVVGIEDPNEIGIDELEPHRIERGERILFRTANSRRRWHDREFAERFVAIPGSTAAYLADIQPALVGVDYLSVGAYEGDGAETHRRLLAAGVWILEGLDLHVVEPGTYELICLPLRLLGAEGAPARAVLRGCAT